MLTQLLTTGNQGNTKMYENIIYCNIPTVSICLMVTEAATREGTLAQGLSDISGAGKEQCVKESQEMSNAQSEHPEPT